MANVVVMASGGGSNFQALAEALDPTSHNLAGLICDRKEAFCFNRAEQLNIPRRYVSYAGRSREEAEEEILSQFADWKGDLLVLAGFMRLLTPRLIEALPGRIINIHPSLLPKYPGTHGIEESFDSGDPEMGITIHYVDHGTDTGPVIRQERIQRRNDETLTEVEARIHALEHEFYPKTVIEFLDAITGDDQVSTSRKR